MSFEPKIIAYLCTWCSYTGADTAGIARLKSPANLRAVRVPCSGRVSPELILRTFDQGADGVLVLGCHIGECHYDSGNHRTARRMPVLRALLESVGLEADRLRLDWVSASEGERFSRITNEFTETVRALGPARWRAVGDEPRVKSEQLPVIGDQVTMAGSQSKLVTDRYLLLTESIRSKARELMASDQVECVIGYEVSMRGRTRPAFIYSLDEVDRLVWNSECSQNLVVYLRERVQPRTAVVGQSAAKKPVAVVAKACDSRAINVLLAENQLQREQVFVIGVRCDGISEGNQRLEAGGHKERLALRCQRCTERTPLVYDTLVGGELSGDLSVHPLDDHVAQLPDRLAALDALSTTEKMEFWLSQFDRCIRCYACRQACPLCNCPTCLYERDDSLWVGMGIRLNEKRAFHLGRAYHLAGRCIECGACERACPVGIPLGLLNQKMVQVVEAEFGFRAGLSPAPSPLTTILSREEG